MEFIRRTCYVCAFLLFFAGRVFGQYSADLADEIYNDIEVWEGRGYVHQLPNIRPLPEVVLVEILKQVMHKGDKRAQERADYYFQKLARLLIIGDLYTNHYIHSAHGDSSTPRWHGAVAVEGRGLSFVASPLVSLSLGLGFSFLADKDNRGTTEVRDYFFEKEFLSHGEGIPDSLQMGSVDSLIFKGVTNVRTSFAVGKSHIYMHAGFMRRSIGPFFDDGLIVSSRAPQSGNIFVYWRGKKLAGTWGLFMLTAEQNYAKFNNVDDYKERTLYAFKKAFFFNALTWYITPDIEFNFWESVMFGDFNFAYLLPLKVIYAIDALSDFVAGNLFIGASLDFRIARTIKIPIVFLVDDLNVNDIIRLNFDTKLKFAFQTGIRWTPIHPIIRKLSLDFQLVMPYTYTHSQTGKSLYSTDYNTTNYTVHGENFATTLEPSSHRTTVELKTMPFRFFSFDAMIRFRQHNNASAGILKGPRNDGSIRDDGYYSVYDETKEGPSFQNRSGFMQGTIEHAIEGGVKIGFDVPLSSRISIYGKGAYTIRALLNHRLVHGNDSIEHVVLFETGMVFLAN